MDSQRRETIRLLVSEARTHVLETQDAKRVAASLRSGDPPAPSVREGRPSRTSGSRSTSRKNRSRTPLPNIEDSRYSSRRPTIVTSVGYRYELRRGDELVRTGHITRPQALDVGERIVISGMHGIVRKIESVAGASELRLVVELLGESIDRGQGWAAQSLPT